MAAGEKVFKKFKNSKLSVDGILYKKEEKLSENIGKPKEIWKII